MSTLQVDRITPYLSASVTIDGDVIQANAATTGSNTFVGDQNIQGTLTASIQEGFVLAGGVGNVSTLVATSSFGGGGSGFPFTGDAVITGSLTISGSNDFDLVVQGKQSIIGPTTGQVPQLFISSSDVNALYGRSGITYTKTSLTSSVIGGDNIVLRSNTRYVANLQSLYGFEHYNGNTNAYINLNIDNAAYANSGWAGPGLAVVNSDSTDYPVVIGFQSGDDYTDGRVTILKPLVASGSLVVSTIDTLPAGEPGQIAFQDGKMWAYISGQWNEISFVPPGPTTTTTTVSPTTTTTEAPTTTTTGAPETTTTTLFPYEYQQYGNDVDSSSVACGLNNTTFFSPCSTLAIGCRLSPGPAMIGAVADGYYASGSIWWEVTDGNGVISASGSCP
jgi:hypothetical protein